MRLRKLNDLPVPCQVSAPVLLLFLLKKRTNDQLVWCFVVFKTFHKTPLSLTNKGQLLRGLPFYMVKNTYLFHVREQLRGGPRLEIGIFRLYV